ncbi:MAG TPA: ureidoglycolate lyase [Gaiellales bacterium]
MTRLAAEPLDRSAFAPFGAVIDRPDRPLDASGPGWSWWAETQLIGPTADGYGVGYLDLQPSAPSFDWAERHMRTEELIAPLSGGCLLYVGPPDRLEQPDALPPLERFRVFRIAAGQGVVLAPGVWHGAPLADGSPATAMVLLQKGTGTDDTVVVRFEHRPVQIDA